jgi:hypothetical protein
MWARNLLFAAVCLLGAGALASNILLQDRIATPRSFEPSRFGNSAGATTSPDEQNDWQRTLSKLNAELRAKWQAEGLQPTGRADDLTLARRLSLGLTGTIPSLEEVRAIERFSEV